MLSNPTTILPPKTDIEKIQETLFEITHTLKHVEENQKTLADLVESKTIHNVEIRHLNASMERVLNAIKEIDTRMAKVETILETSKEKRNGMAFRGGVLETMREYWHLIAIAATAISFFFGIKIKD